MKTARQSLFLLVALAACRLPAPRIYSAIDNADKSVTVPAGSSGILGPLKEALQANGWRMVVYQGPVVKEGVTGANTNTKEYQTFNTRYRLLASSVTDPTPCLGAGKSYDSYDISFIDNRSGAEVFTLSADSEQNNCEKRIVQLFIRALQGGAK